VEAPWLTFVTASCSSSIGRVTHLRIQTPARIVNSAAVEIPTARSDSSTLTLCSRFIRARFAWSSIVRLRTSIRARTWTNTSLPVIALAARTDGSTGPALISVISASATPVCHCAIACRAAVRSMRSSSSSSIRLSRASAVAASALPWSYVVRNTVDRVITNPRSALSWSTIALAKARASTWARRAFFDSASTDRRVFNNVGNAIAPITTSRTA
jgi:hypothetical protein